MAALRPRLTSACSAALGAEGQAASPPAAHSASAAQVGIEGSAAAEPMQARPHPPAGCAGAACAPAAGDRPPGQGGAGPPANQPRQGAAGLPALESRESLGLLAGLPELEASRGASGSSSGSRSRSSSSRPPRLRTTPSRRWVPRIWRACCRHRLRQPLLTIQRRLTGAAASLPCGSIMNRAVLFARSTKAAVDDHVTTLTRSNACDSEQPPRTGAVRCNPPPVSQFMQGALRIVALAGGCPPHCARARLAEPNQDMAESRPV